MKTFIKSFTFFWIGIFLFLPCSNIQAQTQTSTAHKNQSYFYLNANFGNSLFLGDLKEKKFWPASVNGHSEWRMGFGLQAGWQISPVFGLRGQTLYGQLAGVSSSSNEYFQSDYFEFNLNGTVSLSNLISGYNADRKWDVYLLAGIGLTNYNSTLYNLTDDTKLARLGYGSGKGLGGRTLEGILLGGLGVTYHINDKWSLQFETANRGVNSDAMDFTKTNNAKHDFYHYTSLGVVFRFGKGKSKAHYRSSETHSIPLLDTKPDTTMKQNQGQPIQPPAKQPVKKEVKQPQKKVEQPVRTILPVQPRIEYRVQIRARYGKPVSLDYLSNKYNIPKSQIRTNMHKGYYIYTVGSYDAYSQAKARREILRTQNGVTDAFVVEFKNGRRVK